MSLYRIFDVAGSGMSAQTVRLNTTASNMANADSVSSSVNQTYRGRHPIFSALLDKAKDPAGADGAGEAGDEVPHHARDIPNQPFHGGSIVRLSGRLERRRHAIERRVPRDRFEVIRSGRPHALDRTFEARRVIEQLQSRTTLRAQSALADRVQRIAIDSHRTAVDQANPDAAVRRTQHARRRHEDLVVGRPVRTEMRHGKGELMGQGAKAKSDSRSCGTNEETSA